MEAFCGSLSDTEMVKVAWAFLERLTDTLCYCSLMAKVELVKLSENPKMR